MFARAVGSVPRALIVCFTGRMRSLVKAGLDLVVDDAWLFLECRYAAAGLQGEVNVTLESCLVFDFPCRLLGLERACVCAVGLYSASSACWCSYDLRVCAVGDSISLSRLSSRAAQKISNTASLSTSRGDLVGWRVQVDPSGIYTPTSHEFPSVDELRRRDHLLRSLYFCSSNIIVTQMFTQRCEQLKNGRLFMSHRDIDQELNLNPPTRFSGWSARLRRADQWFSCVR